MRNLILYTSALLPLVLAGCATETADLTPTPEQSEYMSFVASQDGDAAARSCLTFSATEVIARGAIGEWAQTAVTLENNCGLDIPVTAVEFIDSDGAFSLASDIPELIQAGGSVEILVDFQAQAEMIHLAQLRILTEDMTGLVKIVEFYGLTGGDSDRSGDPPNAVAGGNFSVLTGNVASLDATGSNDPEGDVLTYRWSFKSVPGGSGLTDSSITDSLTDTASFTPDVDGTYRVRLVVADGTSIDKTFRNVVASGSVNTAPVADAGATVVIELGNVATADGSGSSDADGDTLSYTWTMHGPAAGSALTTASLSGAATDTASFTPDVAGAYLLKLRVGDGLVYSKDFLSVYATVNTPPVSDAGPNQSVTTGSLVDLNGSGSSDDDGDTLTYTWSFKTLAAGSALVNTDIADRTTANASFTPDVDGTYRVRLTVNDGTVGDVDFVDITASTP